MGNLVQITPIATQVETKNGEVTVTINLNLNFKIDSENFSTMKKEADLKISESTKIKFEKPDFDENSQIINFGKQI